MFTINDMMEMVKQGKTTEEIKELYAIGKEIENSGSGDPAGAGDPGAGNPGAGTETKPQETKPEETDPAGKDPDPGKGGDPDSDADDNIDWKKEYEELKAKYQQKNVRENIQGQFDDQKSSIEKGLDILSEMIR